MMLLTLEPSARIEFSPAEGEKFTSTLKITNVSDATVAWKVRTTSPKAFLVLPRSGVLPSSEHAEATITLLPDSGESDFRFEVQATRIETDCDRLEREAWAEIPCSAIQVVHLGSTLMKPKSSPSSAVAFGSPTLESENSRVKSGEDEDEGSWRENYGYSQYRDTKRSSDSRVTPPSLADERRAVRQRQSVRRSSDTLDSDATSKARTVKADAEEEKNQAAPMGPKTKALLAVLIGILVVNLYLRPMLAVAFEGS